MFVIELSETTVEKRCDRCGQPIKPGEGYAETDIGSGKWVHWPSCPKKEKQSGIEYQSVGSDLVHDRLVAEGWKPTVRIPRVEEALKTPGKGGSSSPGLAMEMAKRFHLPERYEFKIVKHYALHPQFPYIAFVKEKPKFELSEEKKRLIEEIDRLAMEMGVSGKVALIAVETMTVEGLKNLLSDMKAEKKALEKYPRRSKRSSSPEKAVSPGRAIGLRSDNEAFLVDGFTMKDYYDLRDLRLLLWGLEKELVGKYGIIEAEPLAGKVRELIKKKVSQVESKIGFSPEHAGGNPIEKFDVKYIDSATGKTVEKTIPAREQTDLYKRQREGKISIISIHASASSGESEAVEAWRKRERIQRPPF